ncbi:MAG: hypothetical protein ACREMY_14415, partial [bacterium]
DDLAPPYRGVPSGNAPRNAPITGCGPDGRYCGMDLGNEPGPVPMPTPQGLGCVATGDCTAGPSGPSKVMVCAGRAGCQMVALHNSADMTPLFIVGGIGLGILAGIACVAGVCEAIAAFAATAAGTTAIAGVVGGIIGGGGDVLATIAGNARSCRCVSFKGLDPTKVAMDAAGGAILGGIGGWYRWTCGHDRHWYDRH